jgi:CBS domain-containing protein
MRAAAGDRIVIRGHRIGEKHRTGEILEVRGPGGTPPFVVRWGDTEHETIFFPGPDADLEPSETTRRAERIAADVGAKAMAVADAIRRSGVAVECDHTIRQAAEVMERSGVGALAVLDGGELVGIVTDRDLVRRALARGMSLDARIDAAMSTPVITIDAEADLHDAFRSFRQHSVRRLAVVRESRFVGMVSVDDLLIDLSNDLADLTKPVAAEIRSPHRDSDVPATT